MELIQTKFEVGQETITGVLQTQSRLAGAIAGVEKSYGEVKDAEATIERLIGHKAPNELEEVNIDTITLPKDFDEFLQFSLINNPAYLASKANYESTKYNIMKSISNVLPSVSANAQFNRSNNKAIDIARGTSPDSDTYYISVNVPILAKGGAEYADIIEKKHLAKKADFDAKETERRVAEVATQSWNAYKTSIALIKSQKETIAAAEKAFEAVKEEANIGTKTTMDILNAEYDLFQAKVALIQYETNKINAVYSILQIMGLVDSIEIES